MEWVPFNGGRHILGILRCVFMKKDIVNPSKDGFTLLELVFAVGVLSLALVITFGSLTGITKMGQVNEGRTRAVALMSSMQEQLRHMQRQQVLTFDPDPVEQDGYEFAYQIEAYSTAGAAVTVPSAGASLANFPNPMEVRVTVVWRAPWEQTGDNGDTTTTAPLYSIHSVTFVGD